MWPASSNAGNLLPQQTRLAAVVVFDRLSRLRTSVARSAAVSAGQCGIASLSGFPLRAYAVQVAAIRAESLNSLVRSVFDHRPPCLHARRAAVGTRIVGALQHAVGMQHYRTGMAHEVGMMFAQFLHIVPG